MKSKTTYTKQEADEIIDLIRLKLKADSTKQKNIRAKIRRLGFHASDFGFRGGHTEHDFLSVVQVIGAKKLKPVVHADLLKQKPKQIPSKSTSNRKDSDEAYVIDLCDEVLKLKGSRQHKFDFLKGDAGTRLPVDIYYPTLNLVIEYRERQHTEPVKIFDQRQTVSGVSRGEQRKIYDQRRREILPQHDIQLIEISYDDFEYDSRKRIMRNRERDIKKVQELINNQIVN